MGFSIDRRTFGLGALAAMTGGLPAPALAQSWPARNLTFIVPYPAGTGADFIGRVLGDAVGSRLNQKVIVENRAGAGATIGTGAFANAPADGYTFLVTGPSPIVNAPLLYKSLSYDPTKFTPISMVMESPIVVLVSSEVPANNLKELVAYAKANPGKLKFGETGAGSTHQLLNFIFKKAANVDINMISYKTVYPMMDLVAGRIDVMLDYPGQYVPHVRAGKVKILANLHTSRHKTYPDTPTMAEAGLPEYPGWLGWFAVLAPAGTSKEVVDKMNAALSDFLKTKEAADKFAQQDYIATPSTPEAVTAKMRQETEVLARIIKENNISLD
jgi:tripartite-type tricarboxylate transporter receptor subunit TctC